MLKVKAISSLSLYWFGCWVSQLVSLYQLVWMHLPWFLWLVQTNFTHTHKHYIPHPPLYYFQHTHTDKKLNVSIKICIFDWRDSWKTCQHYNLQPQVCLFPMIRCNWETLWGFFEHMHFVRGSRKDWQAWETRLIKIRSVSNCLQWGSIGEREKRVHDNQGTLDIPRLQIKSNWPCEWQIQGPYDPTPPPLKWPIWHSHVQGICGQVNSFKTTLQLLSSATSTSTATPSSTPTACTTTYK